MECINFALSSVSLRENLAVSLNLQTVLDRPCFEQRRIVGQLKQCGAYLLRFRHVSIRQEKARFPISTIGIVQISQLTDTPFADMESSCADIKDIAVAHGHRAGESDNAKQISFGALLFAGGAYLVPAVLETIVCNDWGVRPPHEAEARIGDAVRLLPGTNCSRQGPRPETNKPNSPC